MSELTTAVAIFGKPYNLTRSRLGSITKVYSQQYLCDLQALRELFADIGEKLSTVPRTEDPKFSFLVSYSDKTHHDGVSPEFFQKNAIPTGKRTERAVLKWIISHEVEGIENELSVTVRISNPINPMMFLQAALSRSANDVDNFEYEMGSTCVTVDGSDHGYADEIFLRVQNWIEARNKPHAFIGMEKFYLRHEWKIDQFNLSLIPLLIVTLASLYVMHRYSLSVQLALSPVIFAMFMVIRDFSRRLNARMAYWAKRSNRLSLFSMTNGDVDAMTEMAAEAKSSLIKLATSSALSFGISIAAGITCWYFLPSA